jgi:hypothetical protein
MERSLAIVTKSLAPDQPDRLEAEQQVAELLIENHRFAEAERLARTSLASAERIADDDHVLLRRALQIHATALIELRQTRAGRQEIERAVALRTAAAASQPLQMAREDFVLARALEETGEHARALAAARKAEAGLGDAPVPDRERIAQVHAWLAAHTR